MAPTGFQGLVNKWVKISRTSSHSQEWSKPQTKRNEEYSTKTAETSTIDSLISKNIEERRQIFRNEKKVYEQKPRPSLSRRSSSKKISSSNSYTDLLRRKNEDFRRECPAFELEVSIPMEKQIGDNFEYDDGADNLGVSVEQLFNPLTTTHTGEFHRKETVEDSTEKKATCENCCDIHEKVQDYVEFTKFLQTKDNIPCKTCNGALSTAIEAAKTLQEDHPFEISCSSKRNSTTSSSPVPILHNESNQHFDESLALMESSRRLFEFMNLHKERMAHLTREKVEWQENLDQKLDHFKDMCQSIRAELSNEKGNAMDMLFELEAQIGQLKSEQTKVSAPVGVYQNPHGSIARHTRMHKFDPGSPPENLHCDIHPYHHRKFSGCSTSSDVLSSISDSSHTASIQDDFMFSLDDD